MPLADPLTEPLAEGVALMLAECMDSAGGKAVPSANPLGDTLGDPLPEALADALGDAEVLLLRSGRGKCCVTLGEPLALADWLSVISSALANAVRRMTRDRSISTPRKKHLDLLTALLLFLLLRVPK